MIPFMESGSLAAGLAAYGVPLITGAGPGAPPAFADLVAGLSQSHDPRFRHCLVPLLLANSSNASEAAAHIRCLGGPAGREARILYTAAAALQRNWSTQLRLAGLPQTPIEDLFSMELEVPAAAEDFGRPCLAALGWLPSAFDGLVFDRAEAYTRMLGLLLEERHLHATTR